MHTLDIFSLSWILASCATLFAAFIRGATGFGSALILAPILLLILSPKSVVVINLVLGLVANIILLFYAFRVADWRKTAIIAAGSLFGIPLGIWMIKVISASALKVLIGGVTVAFAIPLIIGATRAFKKEKLVSGISGFLSGILSSSTSLAGPPVVLFMHNQNWSKEVIHSSLVVYFLFVCAFSLGGLYLSGEIDVRVVLSAISLLPALLVGLGLGMIAFRRINVQFFRRLSMAVVICAGILGILSGLGVFP